MIFRVYKRTLIFSLVLLFVIMFGSVFKYITQKTYASANTGWYDNYAEGEYEISTAEELAYLATLVNDGTNFNGKIIKLTEDIDLSIYGSEFNSGKGWIPIGKYNASFKGEFDGNGYKINGLYINNNSLDYAGLFGCVDGAIKDLSLENINITARTYAGGIAGQSLGIINKCYVKGAVNGYTYVGGIIGYGLGGVISNCCFAGEIYSSNNYAGSIVGYTDVNISYCYSEGTVTGNNQIGGIAGVCNGNGTISNCVALSTKISGGGQSGRIAGSRTNNGSFLNNYARDDMANKNNNTNWSDKGLNELSGNDVAYAAAKIAAFYTDSSKWSQSAWDEDIWLIEDNELPKLKFSQEVKINIETADITADSVSYTYNQNIIYPVIICDGTTLIKDIDYTISITSLDDLQTSAGIQAGNVTANITGKGDYTGTKTISYTITKAAGSGTIRIDDWVCGYEASTPLTDTVTNGAATVEYSSDGVEWGSAQPETAGTYYIRATFAATRNYLEYTTENVVFHITEKAAGLGAIAINGWIYGQTQNMPIITDTNNTGYRIEYKLQTSEIWLIYVETFPGLGAGVYDIRAVFIETEDYNSYTAESTFIVEKAEGCGSITISGWAYGQTQNMPVVTDTNSTGYIVEYKLQTSETWLTYNEAFPILGAGVYGIRVIFAETEDYNSYTAESTFTVSKGVASSRTIILTGWTYGQSQNAPLVTNSDGAAAVIEYKLKTSENWQVYEGVFPVLEAGIYDIRAVFAETENYNSYTAKNTFNVEKAEGFGTVNISGWIYGAPNAPIVNTTTNGKAVIEYSSDGIIWTLTVPADVGIYYIRVTFAATVNYLEYMTDGTDTFEISQCELESTPLNVDSVQYTYSKDTVYPVIKRDGMTLIEDVDYVIIILSLDGEGTSAGINAGEVTAEIEGQGGYTGVIIITYMISKADVDMNGVVFDTVIKYDGNSHSINISGLPEGVEVDEIINNMQAEKGTYIVIIKFKVTDSNYNAPEDLRATLLINNTGTWDENMLGHMPFQFPSWAFGFAAIPIFILLYWLAINIKNGNLVRETKKAMINEQIEYYGLEKKSDKIFKKRASAFTAEEVRERIKRDKEKKREERMKLRKRNIQF